MIDETLKQPYYRARAGEYNEWFYREGRYDRGRVDNRAWFDEVRIVAESLGRFGVHGDVLDLACGTGVWTGMLAARGDSVTAVDASPEVMQINEVKLRERSLGGNDLSAEVRLPSSTARGNDLPNPEETRQLRLLNGGRSYEIVKVYYSPHELQEQLHERGFAATVECTGRYFLYGYGEVGSA